MFVYKIDMPCSISQHEYLVCSKLVAYLSIYIAYISGTSEFRPTNIFFMEFILINL